MNIIYVSSLCSDKKFWSIFKDISKIPGQQIQKYHRLLAEGFTRNGYDVFTVSAAPITSKNHENIFFKSDSEIVNGINYFYISLINFKIFKNFTACFNTAVKTIKLLRKNKGSIIICDVLNISSSIGALIVSKVFNTKSVAIITDMPSDIYSNRRKTLVKINNLLINSFDSYILLTEQMNELVNRNNKPYIVLEGHVDKQMENYDLPVIIENKKICIYAGMIAKKYGIGNLVEGFLIANVPNTELHIFGEGDYKNELKIICAKYKNIKYFGNMPNTEIIEREINATLLINPRPTHERFTRYSFPSKNMEYMVSGTPVLTTKLPGMPKEYFKYVYLIEDESIKGIAKILREVLNKPLVNLKEKGTSAKTFVLEKKNNEIQAGKIISFLEGTFNK